MDDILEPLFTVIEIDDDVIDHLRSFGKDGIDALVEAATATDDSSASVKRTRAVYALGQLRARSAFRTLRHLVDDDSPSLRLHAIQSLTRVGGPNAVEPLLAIVLDSERTNTEKAHALDGLGRVGDDAALGELEHWVEESDSLDLEIVAGKTITDIRSQLDAIERDKQEFTAAYCEW